MKKYLILFIIIPVLAFGQQPMQDKLITLIGFAEIEIEPDIIVLGMSAKENENSKNESSTAKMENNITSFLSSIGIKPDNFTLDRYNANTRFSFTSSSKFKLTKSYYIVIDKINLLDTIMAKCMEYGMENLFIKKTDHSKMNSLQDSLLVNALTCAKKKAMLIAGTLNANLGKVSSVNETYQIINNIRSDYDFNNVRLEEVTVVGYGTQSKRSGSSISIRKLNLSKTIVAKFELN